jgi:hypothetical protein
MRWAGGVEKTRRLLTVNSFIEMPMEEGIFDVQLMDGPRVHRGNAQHKANGCRFDDRTESLTIVHSMLLRETMHHPACLVPRKRAVGMELVAKNLLSGYHVDTCRTRNQRPRVILH